MKGFQRKKYVGATPSLVGEPLGPKEMSAFLSQVQ